MNVARRILAAKRRKARDELVRAYSEAPDDISEQHLCQLHLFNEVWDQIRRTVPFYSDLVDNKKAPTKFESWDEYITCIPAMSRRVVQKKLSVLIDRIYRPDFFRKTGGTTAEPVQLPAWKSELLHTDPDLWLGRSWYRINPEDSAFLIWGHSHLLGNGLRGRMNRHLRALKDMIRGTVRISAYDLSDNAMKIAANAFLRAKPDYIVGYSVALDRFARVNCEKDLSGAGRVKAVIGTAEAFPAVDTEQLLSHLFKAPIAMEYGSVETGALAHTRPQGDFLVYWKSYFIEALERGPRQGYVVRVTSLYPRCFPLLRYELGDEIEIDKPCFGVTSFRRVLGRCNDFVRLHDGSSVHSELITHCVRDFPAIINYQMVVDGQEIKLNVRLRGNLSEIDKKRIVETLSKINPVFQKTVVVNVDTLDQTIAGKTPMILNR